MIQNILKIYKIHDSLSSAYLLFLTSKPIGDPSDNINKHNNFLVKSASKQYIIIRIICRHVE